MLLLKSSMVIQQIRSSFSSSIFSCEYFFLFVRTLLINSTDYLLYLIVYYTYPATCFTCNLIASTAVYDQPQLSNTIQIRNAALVDISAPIYVMDLSKYYDSKYLIFKFHLNNILFLFLFNSESVTITQFHINRYPSSHISSYDIRFSYQQ